MSRRTIGLFGGTFDPIHLGHLRMALELKQALELEEMRLLPAGNPPHRQTPRASAEHRAAMVKLALANCPDLQCDLRECDLREGSGPEPAYSIRTLENLRRELGGEVSLCLAMGMDSLASLNSWHRWRELVDQAHLIVAARPGWQRPEAGEVAELIAAHQGEAEDLKAGAAGKIVIQRLSLLPISSTGIRDLIKRQLSPQFLLPDSVWAYIREHGLYDACP